MMDAFQHTDARGAAAERSRELEIVVPGHVRMLAHRHEEELHVRQPVHASDDGPRDRVAHPLIDGGQAQPDHGPRAIDAGHGEEVASD